MPRTLVVSDLHLGAYSRGDVARRARLRAPLLEALDGVDRLVLLGDVLEFRDGPVHRALEAARDFFEDVGRVLGPRPVVIVPGNHDYELIAPWLERRRRGGDAPPLGLEELASPAEASDEASAIADWLGQAELQLAYPGLWLRDDVYATHGHYADRYVAVPSFERLGGRLVDRVVRGGTFAGIVPDDYEAALSPVYALLHAVAQFAPASGTGGSGASARAYKLLAGAGGRRRVRSLALGGLAWPALVAGLNRAGLGPVSADLSGAALRRAFIVAMGTVVERLDVAASASHVVFGHFHRAGPFASGDDPREWTTPSGAQLVNCGSWLYGELFLTATPGESPYWPGACVWVDDEGPPRVDRLLGKRTHAELRPD